MPMRRTTLMLPEQLRFLGQRHARERGISFGALLRELLEERLDREAPGPDEDPFFSDKRVWTGPVPADLSARHDDYLYGDKSEDW